MVKQGYLIISLQLLSKFQRRIRTVCDSSFKSNYITSYLQINSQSISSPTHIYFQMLPLTSTKKYHNFQQLFYLHTPQSSTTKRRNHTKALLWQWNYLHLKFLVVVRPRRSKVQPEFQINTVPVHKVIQRLHAVHHTDQFALATKKSQISNRTHFIHQQREYNKDELTVLDHIFR